MPIFLINLLVGIALSLASTLIQAMLAQDQKQKEPGVRGTLQTGGDNPLAFILGTYATGGQLEYAGTWGNVDETPNAYYTKVISLSDLPINAVSKIFVGGELVTLGPIAHATRGYPVVEYNVDGTDYLWIKFYDGTQTSADPLLLTIFGLDADRPWQSGMVGRGVPYAIATARVNGELFSGLPDYLFEVEGAKLYDPRLDDTVGGDGDQRLDDPGTWLWSDNPVVAIYNILLGIYYDGDWVYGPQATAQTQLPYGVWSAEMDKCDVLVPLNSGGTEKRFRFGAEILVSDEPQAIIGELLKSCEGRIAEIGGFYKILVAEPDDPVKEITDQDIVISEGQTYEPFPGLEDTFNGITATYPEPEESWQTKEAPARYDAALELADGNNRLPFDTNYSMVPYPFQVQRLMSAALLETRQFRKHSFTGLADWWEYEPLDVFTWTSDRNGYEEKNFLITVLEDLPAGNQVVGSQEIDPTDYTGWTVDDEIPFDTSPIVIARPPPQQMVGWAVAPYVLVDTEANARRPGIEISYAGGLDDVRAVQVHIRKIGDTVPFFDAEFPYNRLDPSPSNFLVGNAILPNETYEVQGKFVPISQRVTEWSIWLTVETPNIKLGVQDIEIEFDDLANEITQQLAWLSSGVRSTLEAFKRIGSIIEESERENYNQRKILERGISVQMGNLEASFTEVIEVALGPGGAIATALESLYAAMGGSSSEVNIRWEASAGPAGYAARYGVTAAVNDGEFRSASLLLDVPSDPLDPTRIVLDADQTVISTDGGATVEAMFDSTGAIIRNLRVGTIEGPDSASYWDLTTGAFRVTGGS